MHSIIVSLLAVSAAAIGGSAVVPAEVAAPTTWAASTALTGVNRPLNAVSCPSAGFCAAVGHMASVSDPLVAETWNGVRWKLTPVNLPAHARGGLLLGVSCTSASDCWATGTDISSGDIVPLAEHWNGTRWSPTALSQPKGTEDSTLQAVSCASASRCVAVGSTVVGLVGYDLQPLAAYWNGKRWTDAQLSTSAGGELNGVSCPSATDCLAAGVSFAGTELPLAERWNGKSWNASTPTVPARTTGDVLLSVSCKSQANCVAVGAMLNGTGQVALGEAWNGKHWTAATPAAPGGSAELLAVSCRSIASCLAGGSYGANPNPVNDEGAVDADVWNGESWQKITVPVPSGGHNGSGTGSQFDGISCASAKECVAVGAVYTVLGENGFAELWNGTTWKITPTA